ncbi:MAG: amidohydrolase family protein [Desulfobacteraceae bacterium]|nr:amidohydrolase family protein [Desulfobacteraceae bacterium]
MFDILIVNAKIHGKKELVQIGCKDGKILEIAPKIESKAKEIIDAAGYFVTPPFIDSHIHLDATLSMGMPRFNQSGTLLEGIKIWGELKPSLTHEAIKARAKQLLLWSIAKGNLVIRSHVDTTDPSLLAVDVLLELRREMKEFVDLQLVAFPQDGVLRSKNAMELLIRALDKGVDVIGGIPHFERTMAEGAESVRLLCELAEQRGLMVDMHCDESDDPHSRYIENLVLETQRLGLHGRVAGSHLTSMHSMDNYYVSKLFALMSEARINCICNPLVNMNLQGRHDTYPKRRGLMRVSELLDAGINVSFGHDDVMDPWYPMGTHDMLEVVHMGAHALHMTGVDQQASLFDGVTINAAKTLNLENYGLAPGCNADMVILQASSKQECIRLRPARLFVIRRGKVISHMPKTRASVNIGSGDVDVDFCR